MAIKAGNASISENGTIRGNDYTSIKLYTPADIATGEKPTTAFSFAPGAKYNLVMGRMKDKYNV